MSLYEHPMGRNFSSIKLEQVQVQLGELAEAQAQGVAALLELH